MGDVDETTVSTSTVLHGLVGKDLLTFKTLNPIDKIVVTFDVFYSGTFDVIANGQLVQANTTLQDLSHDTNTITITGDVSPLVGKSSSIQVGATGTYQAIIKKDSYLLAETVPLVVTSVEQGNFITMSGDTYQYPHDEAHQKIRAEVRIRVRMGKIIINTK